MFNFILRYKILFIKDHVMNDTIILSYFIILSYLIILSIILYYLIILYLILILIILSYRMAHCGVVFRLHFCILDLFFFGWA